MNVPMSLTCPICGALMEVLPAKSAKSGKPYIQLKCPVDARHFRGFIHDREFVETVLLGHVASHDSPGNQVN